MLYEEILELFLLLVNNYEGKYSSRSTIKTLAMKIFDIRKTPNKSSDIIFSILLRCIQNPAKHLKWSILREQFFTANFSHKTLYHLRYDRVLIAPLYQSSAFLYKKLTTFSFFQQKSSLVDLGQGSKHDSVMKHSSKPRKIQHYTGFDKGIKVLHKIISK